MLDWLTAGAKVAGYFIDRNDAKKRAQHNENVQREFAQNSIRWRVEDAKRAGIHPAYALGAPTVSGSGQLVGGASATDTLASASQDISRAVNATRTAPERADAFTKSMQELQLTRGSLENELLASKIAQLKSSINPPMPTLHPEGKPEERPALNYGGSKWDTDAGSSNTDDWVKRYGEGAEYIMGPMTLWRDYDRNNPHGAAFLRSVADYLRKMNPSVELGRRIGNLPHRFKLERR